MLQAVLFDLDGTLLDTAPDFAKVLNLMRRRRQQADIPYADVRATVSDGARALVTLAFGLEEGDTGFEELREELLELYSEHLADESRLFPGMDRVLTTLEARGIHWGIVTNKPHDYTAPLLQRLQLDTRCGVAICPDHVENRKPNPESIYLACQRLGCDAEHTVYVGDHRRDIEAGRNAGTTTVACNYGYIHADDPPASWQPDYVIDRADQLLDILESL